MGFKEEMVVSDGNGRAETKRGVSISKVCTFECSVRKSFNSKGRRLEEALTER